MKSRHWFCIWNLERFSTTFFSYCTPGSTHRKAPLKNFHRLYVVEQEMVFDVMLVYFTHRRYFIVLYKYMFNILFLCQQTLVYIVRVCMLAAIRNDNFNSAND